jgi:hypothetical protein
MRKMKEKENFVFGILFRASDEAFIKIERVIAESGDLIYIKKAPACCHLRISEEPRNEGKEVKQNVECYH